jgi:acyl-CoA dehydrogenase
VISYAITDDESSVIDASRQVARSADPWEGLVDGGWLDLLLEDPSGGLGFLGFVAEELGEVGVAVPLATTAGLWPTLFGTSAQGKKVGVVLDGLCEGGADAQLVVVTDDATAEAFDEFDVEAVGGLEGDRLARVVVRGRPTDSCGDAATCDLGLRRATALTCAEMAGLIRRAFEMTLEHLRTREQFGKPLSAFQVIQHDAARLATFAEAATWGARLAAHDPSAENVHAAKGWISGASQQVVALTHQLHGAIGFTEEYGLQRLSKRLRTLRFTFGDDRSHHLALARSKAAAD